MSDDDLDRFAAATGGVGRAAADLAHEWARFCEGVLRRVVGHEDGERAAREGWRLEVTPRPVRGRWAHIPWPDGAHEVTYLVDGDDRPRARMWLQWPDPPDGDMVVRMRWELLR